MASGVFDEISLQKMRAIYKVKSQRKKSLTANNFTNNINNICTYYMALSNNNNLAKIGRGYLTVQTVIWICICCVLFAVGADVYGSSEPIKTTDKKGNVKETNPKHLGGGLMAGAVSCTLCAIIVYRVVKRSPALSKIYLGTGILDAIVD